VSVALLRSLRRRAKQLTDALPGQPLASGSGNCFDDLTFTARPGDRGALDEVLLDRAFVTGLGVVVLEPLGEFVGVVEDLLDRSRHVRSPGTLGERAWHER
jgi:hypothetical protein